MGFTKLDSGLIMSSVMSESAEVFKIWIALLAICGPDGIARASSTFLSGACFLSLDTVDAALEKLASPDPRSRTEAEEGRRIRKVDGGYFVINYAKYRAFSYSSSKEAEKKRRQRQRRRGQKGDMGGHVPNVPGHSASASASASYSSSGKKRKKRIKKGCESAAKVRLVLDEEPKRWEGITAELKALWAKTYPGCDVEAVLQEMIAFWDAQPPAKRKLNWKRTIVNRLKWLQDHGGTAGHAAKGAAPGTWLKRMKDREGRGEKI